MSELFGVMKVVKSAFAIDSRMVVVRHPIRKRRRNWSVRRETRPGIWLSEVQRTIYVHPDIYELWRAGRYRRGDWTGSSERGAA